MNAVLTVALFQLRKNLLSRGFLLSLLALPALVVLSIGTGIVIEETGKEEVALGVVDPAGVVKIREVPGVDEPPEIRIFMDVTDARAALEVGEIQAYYNIPANYPQNALIDLVFYTSPPWETQEFFGDLLRTNLLAGTSEDLVARAVKTPEITVHSLKTGRSFPNSGPTLGLLAPVLVALVYTLSIFPIAELVAGTLGNEKANRTVEIVMTSIRASDLIFGKLIAASILLAIEIAVWLILLVGGIWGARMLTHEPWLYDVNINWVDMGQIIALTVSGLVFYCAALVFIGALFSQDEDVRQAASLVILPLFLPIYVLPVIVADSESVVAQIFAFLPITSAQTMGIQLLFTTLPAWKVLAAVGFNIVAAIMMIWLAARAFRSGMLRYGKRIGLKDLFARSSSQGGGHVS